ncbi:hypothetical protein QFZ99_007557 [Paraburkholderia atlantica]
MTLGVRVLGNEGIGMVLPILSRLVPETGNINKLWIALALVRAVSGVIERPIRVLFDSWFMRARLVLPLLRRNTHVIGHAGIDTVLFRPAVRSGGPRPGRPRIYGKRLSAEAIEALCATGLTMKLYGKEQRLRSTVAVARFLKGTPVRAVWCQFYNDKRQEWTKRRLILASEVDLEAQTIVQLYARRWGHRTAVSQSQALVGIQQSLAADAHPTRTLDADSFVRMDSHAVAQPGDCRGLPHARNCAVENRSARHRWLGRPMAASGIYRTCLPHSPAAEVWKTPEARSGSRPLSYQSMPLLRPRLLASSQSQSRSPSDRQRTATAFECLKLSLINKVFYGSKSKKTIGDMRARDHRGERS